MPRSQPSTVEKLTGEFLKLSASEQAVVHGVFGAIVKTGVRPATMRRTIAAPAAPVAVIGVEHVAKPATRRRKPRRRPEPVAAAETSQYAEPAETEQS